MTKPKQDRLDEIKLLLELADDRVGPDSSLRWLIGEVDRLRGELRVLQTLIERIVVRVSEAIKLNPVLYPDPFDQVDRLATRYRNAVDLIDTTTARQVRMYDAMTKARGFVSEIGIEDLLEHMLYQRRGLLSEEAAIHDLAAEALGYQRAPSLEEDPNCPCPGQFITGEHTAQTLVMELVKKYQELQTKGYGQGQ